MKQAFLEGGWGMYPILVFGLVLLAASGRHALSPDRNALPVIGALGLVTFVAGLLGFVTGVITTTRYLGEVPADRMPTIALAGVGESLNNVAFALCFLVLAGLCVAFASLRRWRGGTPPEMRDAAPVTVR